MFTGFTKLCKGLAVVLVAGHIAVQVLPVAVTYLALIPARYISLSLSPFSLFGFQLLICGFMFHGF